MSDDLGTYIAKFGADLIDLKRGMLEGRQQMAGFQQVVEQGAAKVRQVLAFAGISLGFYELISQAKEFGRAILEEGGKVEVLRASALAIGSYYQMSAAAVDFYVQKIKEKGIIEANALQATTAFLKAGISLDKLPQLAEAAGLLGRSMGLPLQEAFNALISGIVKGTPKQLAEMVPGIKEVLQSMSSETKKLMDSQIISSTEKAEILLNATLAMAEKLKGSVESTSDSYFSKLNEYKVKVASVKAGLFELLKPIGMAITREEIKSWDDFYTAVGKNKEALRDLGESIALYVGRIAGFIRSVVAFTAAHKDLGVTLLQVWSVLKVFSWVGITAEAAMASLAITGVVTKLTALRLALAGPWALVIAVSMIGGEAVMEGMRKLAKPIREEGQSPGVLSKYFKTDAQLAGEKLSPQERQQMVGAVQGSGAPDYAAQLAGSINEQNQARAAAARAARAGAQEHALPPGGGKGGGKDETAAEYAKQVQEYLKMVEAIRQADLKSAESGLEILKAGHAAQKAWLDKDLADRLIDGQTYYQKLQEMEQEETAQGLALIEVKRQAQIQAHADALEGLGLDEKLSPEVRAYRTYDLEVKNRAELAKLDADAAKLKLDGEARITNELTRQVNVRKEYRDKTEDLNLDTAQLLGAISEQEGKLQKLYLDWQRTKQEALKAGASPEYFQALDRNLQAKQFDASPLGQRLKDTSQMFSSAFSDLASSLVKGGTKFSAAVEAFGQKLEQDTFKIFFDDLSRGITQGIRNMVSSIANAMQSGGGGGLGSFFSGLGNWFSGLFGGGTDYALQPGASVPFAHGGVVAAFASGGILTRPTLFRAGRGLVEAGEAGPEGFLPLGNVGGNLGVHALFPKPGPAQVNIINNTGTEAQGTAQQKDDGTLDIILEKKVVGYAARGPLNQLIRAMIKS